MFYSELMGIFAQKVRFVCSFALAENFGNVVIAYS